MDGINRLSGRLYLHLHTIRQVRKQNSDGLERNRLRAPTNSKTIEYIEFPMAEEVSLYFTNNTILLPSEY
jgi:hypothetical protein